MYGASACSTAAGSGICAMPPRLMAPGPPCTPVKAGSVDTVNATTGTIKCRREMREPGIDANHALCCLHDTGKFGEV